MTDHIGQQFGNYRLIRSLGRGVFAEVYLGEDVSSKTQVAVKVMKTQLTINALRDIINEERAFQLTHPHIIQIQDYGVEGDTLFLVMDYIPNGSLRKHQALQHDEIISYLKQVTEALEYSHSERVIHGNIKPENLLLGQNNEILLSGFDIAAIAQGSSLNLQNIARSVSYKAPEQHLGHLLPASDQYALGVIVYEWLSGQKPFNGSVPDIIEQHLNASPAPLRTKDPAISPEVDRVILKALEKEPQNRFKTINDFTSSLELAYRLAQNLGPANPTTPVVEPVNPTTPVVKQVKPSNPVNKPVNPPLRRRGRNLRLPILILVFLLLSALVGGGFLYSCSPRVTPPMTRSRNNSIGVTQVPDGEHIGISDGTFAFDTKRPDGDFKTKASRKLKAGDIAGAESLWNQANEIETNDAETLIYVEDQRVLASHLPYITLAVGTILTGDFLSIGRDNLQGAYVAQQEYNRNCKLPSCVQIRLLVANSGSGNKSNDRLAYAGFIMQQIVQAAQNDNTIVGVMGWPLSSNLLYVSTVLESTQIPLVSPAASIDSPKRIIPYIFHVAPTNMLQGIVGAEYAVQTLHAKQVVLFVDPLDPYSYSLATAFKQRFTTDNTVVATENYTVGKPETVLSHIQDALQYNPNLIYFAGYPQDVSALLTHLPICSPSACLPVLGGDTLYDLGGYSPNARYNFDHLRFTAFAYPDEWDILGLKGLKPVFFSEYPIIFDPNGQHRGVGGIYTYSRADNNVVLSYDAMLALLEASKDALIDGKTNLTPTDLQQALTKITGDKAIQGVSGQISFESNNNPVDKPVVVLCVDKNPFIHVDEVYGQFLVGESIETRVHLDPACLINNA